MSDHGLTSIANREISLHSLNPKSHHFLGTGGLLDSNDVSDLEDWPTYFKKEKMKFHLIQNYNKIQSGLHNCRIGGYFSVGNKIYYKKSRNTAIKSTVGEAISKDWVTREELADRIAIYGTREVSLITETKVDVILFKYFAYDAGDKDPKTFLAFGPNKILSSEAAVNNKQFMEDIRSNFIYNNPLNSDTIPEWLQEKDESDNETGMCIVSYMPQFRTFTLACAKNNVPPTKN